MFKKLFAQLNLLQLKSGDQTKVTYNPKDKFNLFIPTEDTRLTSIKDGSEFGPTSDIDANQTFLAIADFPIAPRDGWLLVDKNPQLAMLGCLAEPITHVIATNEAPTTVGLIIRTTKMIDLTEIPYLIKLYYI